MKNFSRNILPYLIGAIFFLVPLFFSHLFKALGFPIILGNSSYERIKVELFYGLMAMIIPIWIYSPFFRKSQILPRHRNYVIGIILCIISICISTVLAPDFSLACLGGTEKQHGILLFIALWIFVSILRTLSETNHIFFIKVSCVSLVCVLGYATMQWLGLDQLGSRYTLSFSGNRAFSTLGNPNYLAGFFILFLPLIQKIVKTRAMRNFWYGLLLFGVTITGGLLGIIITLGYGILQIFPLNKKKQWYVMGMIIPAIFGMSMMYSFIPTEKMGSMENRMIIWKTSLQMVSISPERLFFGYGLEQFKNQFPLFVDGKNAQYFTNNTPDRAHNIFLDILFSFGLFGLSFCIIFLVGFFRKGRISSPSSQIMILFLIFFSFNIPVLVHFLIVGLVFSSKE